MAEILLLQHPFAFVMAEPPSAPNMIRRRRVIVRIVDFQPGTCYYVGYMIIDETSKTCVTLYDEHVATSRFAVTIYSEARVLFVSTTRTPPYTVLPIAVIDIVKWTEAFEMPDTTLVNRV